MNQHLMQVDWRASIHDEMVQVLPVGNEAVHITATTKKQSTVKGVTFPLFGIANVLYTSLPIVVGGGDAQMVIGQASHVEIARLCILQLKERGVPLTRIALSILVPEEEQADAFFDVLKDAGLTNILITSLSVIANEQRVIEMVRPNLQTSGSYTLH